MSKKLYTALDMKSNKIENVTDPTADQDAATKAYVDTHGLQSVSDGTTEIAPTTTLTVPPNSLSGSGTDAILNWDRLVVVGDAGASQNLDLVDGNVFDLTFTEACVITLDGATPGYPSTITVVKRGAWATTWPAEVSWLNDVSPSASVELEIVTLWSMDGGTTWGGSILGTGSEAATRWVPMTIDPLGDGNWQLLFTDDGDVYMMEVAA